jgi:methyl-accepting chemotaxis protein
VKVLTFLAYQNIQSLVNDANWVKYTHLVTSNASSIEKKLVIDMETGERGYLISGKEEFLEPYE